MTRRPLPRALIGAIGLAVGVPQTTTAQQPLPVGSEFQVNTFTTGSQWGPAVSADAAGNFVVVWVSAGSVGSDSSATSIQGQRFGANGAFWGAQFQANTYTMGWQDQASVSVADDGTFIVVWKSESSFPGGDTSDSIQGQRYAADGTPLGTQFQVNTYTPGPQYGPSVASDADGDFVVTWASLFSDADPSLSSVHGRRFASDGTAQGPQFQLNSETLFHQFPPSVAMSADGDFVVVWASEYSSGTDSGSDSIQGRRFSSGGTPLGSQFQANTVTANGQFRPRVSLDAAGNFVVAWWSSGGAGGTSSVQGQRYAANGVPLGGEFQVKTFSAGPWAWPGSVSMGADGFVVVFGGGGSNGKAEGRRYAADGAPLGSQFLINTFAPQAGSSPAVSLNPDGRFVVVWQSAISSGSDISSESIQARLYDDSRPYQVFIAESPRDLGLWAEP